MHTMNSDWDKLDWEKRIHLLEYTCLLLNTRPLGHLKGLELLTSDLLAYGFTRSTGTISDNRSDQLEQSLTKQMKEARDLFIQYLWPLLKEQVSQNLSRAAKGRNVVFTVAQTVLVYFQPKYKLDSELRVAHVLEQLSDTRYLVKLSNGNTKIAHSTNLIALKFP